MPRPPRPTTATRSGRDMATPMWSATLTAASVVAMLIGIRSRTCPTRRQRGNAMTSRVHVTHGRGRLEEPGHGLGAHAPPEVDVVVGLGLRERLDRRREVDALGRQQRRRGQPGLLA